VLEFGFGYPPRAFGKKIGETIYSINWVPFGGFARIKGVDSEDRGANDPDSFAVQTKIVRTLILCGGIIGNFILAWVIFSILFSIGNPVPAGKVLVDEVADDSPAAAAGIAAGDYILSFGGEKVGTPDELNVLVAESIGRLSVVEVERGGVARLVALVPRAEPPEGEGPLGIVTSAGIGYEKVAVWRAPLAAAVEVVMSVGRMVRLASQLVGNLFQGKAVEVGGPVAILALTETYASCGVPIFLQFIALLSVNLVVVNLLPFPALDGGRLFFIGYEAVCGRKASPWVEKLVNNFGFAFLVFLMILITIKDIRTFF